MEENEQVSGDEGSQANPVKEKASAQGWVEKEQFRGDPAKWVDADEFVKRGENILPVLKERNDHLVKEMQEMKKTFGEYTEYARKGEERAYQRAMKELEGRQLVAVQEGDVESFQSLKQEEIRLQKERESVPAKQEQVHPSWNAFLERNKWYEKDTELTQEADIYGAGLHARGIPIDTALPMVEERLKKLYPEKFGNPRRDAQSSVEFSADTGLPKKAPAKTYDNLPKEAKDACEKFIARGYVKSKEEYLKNYDWGA